MIDRSKTVQTKKDKFSCGETSLSLSPLGNIATTHTHCLEQTDRLALGRQQDEELVSSFF